jgi:hypothetical protein
MALAAVGLALLVSLRYWVVPSVCPAGADLCVIALDALDNLLASTVSGTVLAVLILYLSRNDIVDAEVSVVEPRDIPRYLDFIRDHCHRYWFSGSVGQFARAVTLPELAKDSQTGDRQIELNLLLLDPDSEACHNLAQFRAGLGSTFDDPNWTRTRVRNEVIATIVAAACWQQAQTNLRISVFLRSSFVLFRVDMSDKGAVITQGRAKEPAWFSKAGNSWFEAHQESVSLEAAQARQLNLWVAPISFRALTHDAISGFLKAAGIDVDDDKATTKEIASFARSRRHPYEHGIRRGISRARKARS